MKNSTHVIYVVRNHSACFVDRRWHHKLFKTYYVVIVLYSNVVCGIAKLITFSDFSVLLGSFLYTYNTCTNSCSYRLKNDFYQTLQNCSEYVATKGLNFDLVSLQILPLVTFTAMFVSLIY